MVYTVAIIVTYNRRTPLLACLSAVAGQTRKADKILIIDNASTDGTIETLEKSGWLLQPNVELVTLEKNIGGAGGFHVGMRLAFREGAEWLWIMDDDCIPEPDCLKNLLRAPLLLPTNLRDNIGFLASRVIWKDKSPCLMNIPVPHGLWIEPHFYSSNLSRLTASSFVSMLVSRKAVVQHGLPVKEFFIWFDDSEFSRRISNEMYCYLVSDSVVTHETSSNFSALDFRQLTQESLWKFSYGIRNEASYHFEKDSLLSGSLFCLRTITRAIRHTKSWKLRFAVARACWSGFRFRYTRYIEHV
ncbi:glycosyltransferase family 2 protein [Ottowia caeni]|uniref:glycosyltransferase family 2 protein n=1 Tax=Ottowia caeni TaxID=2870339 RepID=UPI001E550514|nr:glycosyltransferase family 2 protein [Ottowia caeni]